MLANLTSNAVKFTDEWGDRLVSNRVEREEPDGDAAVRSAGYRHRHDPEQIGRLFQSFTRPTRQRPANTVAPVWGWPSARQLVEMMGGEIWVESEVGQGSTFTFTATFDRPLDAKGRRLVPSLDLMGLRVLVVDDNPVAREALQSMLESFTFHVSTISSGDEGLAELERVAREKPYELVIMDQEMPGMNGIEASRRIKGHPWLSKIPIIMVTAHGRGETIRQAAEIGLDGYLLKPVSQSALFDAIMQAFGEEIFPTPANPNGTRPGSPDHRHTGSTGASGRRQRDQPAGGQGIT